MKKTQHANLGGTPPFFFLAMLSLTGGGVGGDDRV